MARAPSLILHLIYLVALPLLLHPENKLCTVCHLIALTARACRR